jgi:hypothetical protein
VCLGYWCDPLLPLMVKRGERKAPEINLGYYARVMGVRLLIHKFFEAHRLVDTNPCFRLVLPVLICLYFFNYPDATVTNGTSSVFFFKGELFYVLFF